ncbi:unnamed protein product [Rhizophagus irregularis]|nr:hypothetical protein GLOIN_2v1783204 [Rhizophagus irregularis DAOM 181602=DAOM 197198]CAB4427609.1 unnamed protein product [Rhizophagus irregularis]
MLIKNQGVVQYGRPGRLQFSLNIHIYMIESMIHLARTILNNYLLPRQANSISERAHHHIAWVAVAHYCLASVKCARQFASFFADKVSL